jgi:methyltransferase (TIGR00027 family)
MHQGAQAVANTGLLVAAIRADESRRPDRLFTDPFAERLAGETGRRLLAEAVAAAGDRPTRQIVVRTRFWDDALLRATQSVRQVVILAAGMDARAFRLSWPGGTTVYELDQSEVIAAKAAVLDGEQPLCTRVAVGVDLTGDWTDALQANGFDHRQPTVWLIEGLLQYLDESAVGTVFERVDALSAPGSVLLYDVVGKTLLDAQLLAAVRQSMARNGAPWLFGTDEPGELAQRHGWSAVVTDVAVPGNEWGRWFAPAVPMDVPDVARGYFVEATK